MSEKDVTITRDGLQLAAKVSIPNSKEYDWRFWLTVLLA